MFRFICVAVSLILFLVLTSPIMLLLLIIAKFNEKLSSKIAQKMVAGIFKIMIFITGAKIEVEGLLNIPEDEAVVFVGNHQGAFDIVLAYLYTKKIFGCISKKELSKYILLREWMLLVNCLFLDRNNIKEGLKTILDAIEKVKKGISIWIFPEGTRSKTGELLEFKEGAFKIATKSKAKIIPVAISGTRDIFEAQFPRIKKGKIRISYLEAVECDNLEKGTKIGEHVRDIIEKKLREQV